MEYKFKMDTPEIINIKHLLTEVLQYPDSLVFLLGLLTVNLQDLTSIPENGFDIVMWMKVAIKVNVLELLLIF